MKGEQFVLPGTEQPRHAARKRREIERHADGSPVLTCLLTVHLYLHGSAVCVCGAECDDYEHGT